MTYSCSAILMAITTAAASGLWTYIVLDLIDLAVR